MRLKLFGAGAALALATAWLASPFLEHPLADWRIDAESTIAFASSLGWFVYSVMKIEPKIRSGGTAEIQQAAQDLPSERKLDKNDEEILREFLSVYDAEYLHYFSASSFPKHFSYSLYRKLSEFEKLGKSSSFKLSDSSLNESLQEFLSAASMLLDAGLVSFDIPSDKQVDVKPEIHYIDRRSIAGFDSSIPEDYECDNDYQKVQKRCEAALWRKLDYSMQVASKSADDLARKTRETYPCFFHEASNLKSA